MKKLQSQDGFTIAELVVVLGISALFVSLILFFGVSYQRYGYTLEADSDTLVTRLNIQDFIRENLGSSAGLITQNGISDPLALNPDTTLPGNNYWEIIHAVPKTITPTGTGTTPVVYYKKHSVTAANSLIFNGTEPYEDEFVLYVDNASKKLYLRTLANAGATNNKQRTSCAPAQATATCPADRVIGSDIASISTRYFSRSGNLIDWTSVYDPNVNQYVGPDYPSVEVIEFTVKLGVRPALEKSNTTKNTTVIRVALRNT